VTSIIERFEDVSSRYDTVLCDLWGCLHNGCTPFPAAVSTLQRFADGGGTVLLLTNSPQLSDLVRVQLKAIGVPERCWHLIVSSGSAAQAEMLSGAVGHKLFHIGPDRNLEFFHRHSLLVIPAGGRGEVIEASTGLRLAIGASP